MSNAALGRHVVFEWTCIFFSRVDTYQWSGRLYGKFVNFLRNGQTGFQGDSHVTFPPATYDGSLFSTSLPALDGEFFVVVNLVALCNSVCQLCPTLCDPMDCSIPGFPVYYQLPERAQTHVHQVGAAIQPSHHLLSPSPAFSLSQLRVFSNESVLRIRYWSFSVSSSKECSGLISFRIDWLDLLAVQGTLKSLLQHHSSKASILRRSAFFMVQLTSIHDHWKNHSFDKGDLCWQCLCFLVYCLD